MAAELVRVQLAERSYDIRVGSGGGHELGAFARSRTTGSQSVVVTDSHVLPHAVAVMDALMAAGFNAHLIVLRPGESEKTLANASYLYDQLAEKGADRHTLIVAVGGGVIGDLAGFVAATFARGLPLLMVPTSLLAMVDSSVGGKTGVNHPRAKNLVGAFHQPRGVWIDADFLHTLPDREYRSGLAEVVKYGVILDAELFAYLEANVTALLAREAEPVRRVVSRSCRLKADVVEQDERETTGLRAILNYGHTFAHAFETVAGYGAWLHGEAVAAGMVCAGRLAYALGRVDEAFCTRQERLLERFELPTQIEPWPIDELLQAMRSDKKTVAGRLRLVLSSALGKAEVVADVPEAQVVAVLESLRREE